MTREQFENRINTKYAQLAKALRDAGYTSQYTSLSLGGHLLSYSTPFGLASFRADCEAAEIGADLAVDGRYSCYGESEAADAMMHFSGLRAA